MRPIGDIACFCNIPFVCVQDLELAQITFELQSANAFWANDVIGNATVPIANVYRRPHHQQSIRLPLNVPGSAELCGILLVNLSVLGSHDLETAGEQVQGFRAELDETLEAAVIKTGIPVKDKAVPYHLFITIYRIEDMRKSDGSRNLNLYIQCEFGGTKLQTFQAKEVSSAIFMETFRFPVTTPTTEDSIILSVMSAETSRDVRLAQGRLSFASIRNNPLQTYWLNLYGLHSADARFFSPKDLELLRARGIPAQNAFLGRIMIGARALRLKRLEQLMNASKVSARMRDEMPPKTVTVFCDVFQVELDLNVLKASYRSSASGQAPDVESVTVSISIGAAVQTTRGALRVRSARLDASRVNRFKQRGGGTHNVPHNLTEGETVGGAGDSATSLFSFDGNSGRIPPLTVSVPADPRQQPDLVLEVFARTGHRLGCRRLRLREIPLLTDVLSTSSPLCIPLENPRAHDCALAAASVLFSLDRVATDSTLRPRRRRIVSALYALRCYVFACRHLPFVPASVTTRACMARNLVRVRCGAASRDTELSDSTRFPIFLQCVEMPLRLTLDAYEGVPSQNPIKVDIIAVIQKKAGNHQEVVLGSCISAYTRVLGRRERESGRTTALRPKWIKLYDGSRTHAGDALLAFELLRLGDSQTLPPQPMLPALQLVTLRMSLYGLRNLVPILAVPDEDGKFEKHKTNSKKGGSEKSSGANANVLPCESLSYAAQFTFLEDKIKRPIVVLQIPNYSNAENGVYRMDQMVLAWDRFQGFMTNASQVSGVDANNLKWSTADGLQHFNFHFVTGVQAFVPSDTIFDLTVVVQVFDGKVNGARFIGETSVSLVHFLPWLQRGGIGAGSARGGAGPAQDARAYAALIAELQAQDSFMARADILLLREARKLALQAIKTTTTRDTVASQDRAVDDIVALAASAAMGGAGATASGGSLKSGNSFKNLGSGDSFMDRADRLNADGDVDEDFDFDETDVGGAGRRTNYDEFESSDFYDRSTAASSNIVDDDLDDLELEMEMNAGGGRKNRRRKIVDYDGRPIIARKIDVALAEVGLNPAPLPRACASLSYVIPQGFLVYCAGRSSASENSGVRTRRRADGPLERLLTDRLWAPRTLYRPVAAAVGLLEGKRAPSSTNGLSSANGAADVPSTLISAGTLHAEFGLSHNKDFKSGLSEETARLCFHSAKLRQHYKAMMPPNLRVRIYIIKASGLFTPVIIDDPDLTYRSPGEIVDGDAESDGQKQAAGKAEKTNRFRAMGVAGGRAGKAWWDFGSGFGSGSGSRARPAPPGQSYNPYLSFTFGRKMEKLRGRAKIGTAYPQFNVMHELSLECPEELQLTLGVWSRREGLRRSDKDFFIGATRIDLEARWWSAIYRAYVGDQSVPMEMLPLKLAPEATTHTGTLELWIDLFLPNLASVMKPVPLKQDESAEVELRVVVWGTRACPLMGEDAIDITVRGEIESAGYKGGTTSSVASAAAAASKAAAPKTGGEGGAKGGLSTGANAGPNAPARVSALVQTTDVHYASRNGNSLFNYRFVFSRISAPLPSCILRLTALQFKSIGNPVTLGEVILELAPYLTKVATTLNRNDYNVELPLSNPDLSASENGGFLQVTLQIVTQTEAASRPVGVAREEPNRGPHLIQPVEGRKWEDFLGTSASRQDYRSLFARLRALFVLSLLAAIVIITLIYPGLFWQ